MFDSNHMCTMMGKLKSQKIISISETDQNPDFFISEQNFGRFRTHPARNRNPNRSNKIS